MTTIRDEEARLDAATETALKAMRARPYADNEPSTQPAISRPAQDLLAVMVEVAQIERELSEVSDRLTGPRAHRQEELRPGWGQGLVGTVDDVTRRLRHFVKVSRENIDRVNALL